MNIRKFAKEIGVGIHYVRSRVESGEIPATVIEKDRKRTYEIDPELVQEWKEKASQKEFSSKTVMTASYKKKQNKGKTPLQNAMKELKEYNERNGTNYSYGEAVALGII